MQGKPARILVRVRVLVVLVWVTVAATAVLSQPIATTAATRPLFVPLLDTPRSNGPPAVVLRTKDGLYRAVHYVMKWNQNIKNWVTVSPDLTQVNLPGSPGYGVDGITALAEQDGHWYVGTLTGQIEVRTADQPWTVSTSGLPPRTVTAIAIDPNDPGGQLAVVGLDGYSSATPEHPGHVYVTLDGGGDWFNISGNLPDAPVQAIEFSTSSRSANKNAPGLPLLQVKVGGLWFIMAGKGHWNQVS
ncbi:MAG: hypothetical protein A2201_01815 [Alicyclobacillus sp. RIFOXYA1_FULL_53_8]|nr:MAG: hypothetical protein A2201_01815 [Alicyclobacillus sp. RIFOXYA1_FULL_53_8]